MRLSINATGLRVLLLAATLILGQWLLGQHLAQVEAHAAGDSCEWCLAHAPLTGALPATSLTLVLPVVHPSAIRLVAGESAADFRTAYVSRAPPRSSAV